MPTMYIKEYCAAYLNDDSPKMVDQIANKVITGEIFATIKNGKWSLSLTEDGRIKGKHLRGDRFLYFFHQYNGDAIKLGATSNVYSRFQQVQVGSPLYLGISAVYKFSCKTGTSAFENICRGSLARFKLRGEWFKNEFNIESVIDSAFERYPYAKSKLVSKHFYGDVEVGYMGDVLSKIRQL